MKKIILLAFVMLSTILHSQNISFKELVSFKTKPVNSIELILEKKGYSFYTVQNKGTQWKANDGSGIIGANGTGVVLFMTYKVDLYKKIISEMKQIKYKYEGKSTNKNLAGESYSKDKNTVYVTTVKNPENGKLIYSITII